MYKERYIRKEQVEMRMLCSEEGLEMKYMYILGVVSK